MDPVATRPAPGAPAVPVAPTVAAALGHRPEIDGLRAVAVVPVMLFHAGFAPFAGGYLGVDVFFVVSGYLIGSILLADVRAGRFSFARFYERRARRLLPALALVLAASLALGWLWMLPSEFSRFAATLAATVLFVSNVQLWRAGNDYFSDAAEENPLLHTWSLSIEEQFYLLFPVALLVLCRALRPRGQALALGALALASLALAEIGSRTVPGGTFFLLPTRGWELLAGTLCAYAHAHLGRRPDARLAALGLALVIGSMALFDADTRMPSLAGLAPVLGTSLVLLYADPARGVGRALALGPLVAVGLVSYSAYLWHQPVLAFLRIRSLGEAPAALLVAGLVASMGLAWASTRWVERPFRAPAGPVAASAAPGGARAMRVPRRALVLWTALPALALLAAALLVVRTGGLPSRVDPSVARADRASRTPVTAECLPDARSGATDVEHALVCTVGAAGVAPTLLVIGDSHAGALVDALDVAMRARGEAAAVYTAGWCAPIEGLTTDEPRKNPRCHELVELALRRAETDPALEAVALVAQWANYVEGRRWGDALPARYALVDASVDAPVGELADAPDGARDAAPVGTGDGDADRERANAAVFAEGWRRTLERLGATGLPVLVVESVPEFEAPVARSVARALLRGEGHAAAHALVPGLEIGPADHAARNAAVHAVFDAPAPARDVRRVATATVFCAERCRYADGEGRPLYSDASHLTPLGAAPLVARVLERLDGGADG